MKKISRIVGLAAALAAAVFIGCAPVTDSGEWKAPIAPSTIKDTELNKTPLTAVSLERLVQGRWAASTTEGIVFTVKNGVKRGYKYGGAPIPVSASVRATIGDAVLYDHEEFTWEPVDGSTIEGTIKKPTSGTDAIAADFDASYNYDKFFKDRAGANADGTVFRLHYDSKTGKIYERNNGAEKVYSFDYANSDEMNVIVGYTSGATGATMIKNSNNARSFDKWVATFKYTTVTRSGTAPTYTYAMGTAEHELAIVDLDADIAELNKLIARGYGIEEFEIPVAFDPDPKIKLMTVTIYNSKEGKTKDYKNIAYTKVTDTTASKIVFAVNGIDYELSMPTTANPDAGGKLTKWYKGSVATATTTVALPLPAATTPTSFTAADWNENGTAPAGMGASGTDDGKGKIAFKTISADDKTGAFFIFKMEDKYVGRIRVADAISRAATIAGAGTNPLARPGSVTDTEKANVNIVDIRNTFFKTANGQNQLIIGDRNTTSYDPAYSIYKPYHDFTWVVDGDTATTYPDAASALTVYIGGNTTGSLDKTMVFNGKFTPHKATFYFFQASDDIIKNAYHMGHTGAGAAKGWLADGDGNVELIIANGTTSPTGATATTTTTATAKDTDVFNEAAMNYGLMLNGTTYAAYDNTVVFAAPGTPAALSELYTLPANGAYQSFEVEIKDLANGMKMADIIAKYGSGLKTPGDITIGDIVYKFKGWSDWYFTPATAANTSFTVNANEYKLSNRDRFQGWQNVGTVADVLLPSNADDTTAAPTYANTRKPLSTEKYFAFQSDGSATSNPVAPFQLGKKSPAAGTTDDDNIEVRLFAQYERKGVYAYFYKANRALATTLGTAATPTAAATGAYATYDAVNPAAKVLVETSMVSQRIPTKLEVNKKVAELYNGTPVADIANGNTPHTYIGAWSATPSYAPAAATVTAPGAGAPAADLTYADVVQRTLADGAWKFYASYMTGAPIKLRLAATPGTTTADEYVYVNDVPYIDAGAAIADAGATQQHSLLNVADLGRYKYIRVNSGNYTAATTSDAANATNNLSPWFDIVTKNGTTPFSGTSSTAAQTIQVEIRLNAAGAKVFYLRDNGDTKDANEYFFDSASVKLIP